MYFKWQENSFLYFLVNGIITWIIFLLSFLLLTEGLMFVMQFEGIALLFIIVGLFCLSLNYFSLKKLIVNQPENTFKANVPIHNSHQVIVSLERVYRVIILLTSLGLLSSLSTFFFISMEYFTMQTLTSLLPIIPLLFIVDLVFAIPSFYGLKELNQIKYFLREFKTIKTELIAGE